MLCQSRLHAFSLKLLKETALAAGGGGRGGGRFAGGGGRPLPYCTEAVKGQPTISSSEWGGAAGTIERQRAAAVIAGCASHGDVQGKVAS
jgi:hypothetical protein